MKLCLFGATIEVRLAVTWLREESFREKRNTKRVRKKKYKESQKGCRLRETQLSKLRMNRFKPRSYKHSLKYQIPAAAQMSEPPHSLNSCPLGLYNLKYPEDQHLT